MKLKFYLSSFLFIVSGFLLLNAQEQKGNSGEEVFSASKMTEKTVDAAASVTVINSKTIENRPTTNVTQLLDNVVGLTLDRQGANRYNITLRDRASIFNTSTVVMMDHRQISTIGLQVFDAANSNLSGLDLERIEVVRGGSISSSYGAYTNSGVVHFMTKDPFKYPGTSFEISTGGLANQESMLGKGNWDIFQASVRHAAANTDGTFGYKINARYSENGEYDIDDATSLATGGQLLDKAMGYNVDATLYFRPSSGLEVTAQAGITGREGVSWSEFYAEAFENNRNNFFNVRMKSGNLTAQYSYSDTNTPTESDDQGYYYRTVPRTKFKNTTDYTESHVSLQYDMSFDMLNTSFSVGAEHKKGEFNSNWPVGTSASIDSQGGIFGRNDATGPEFRIYGAYFQSRSALTDNIHLVLGGRYDQYTNLNEGAFSPKAALVLKPNSNSSFRLSASQATTSSNVQTMFRDHGPTYWNGFRGTLMGNATQQTFNNPYVTLIPPLEPLRELNPIFYQGLGLDTFSIYLALSPQVVPLLAQSVVSLYVNVPAFFANPSVANSLVANSSVIDFDLVGSNTDLEASDTAAIATETTYEIGYKAELKRWKVGVDIYRSTKENFAGVELLSPLAQLPDDGAGIIAAQFGAVFGRALGGSPLANALGAIMGNAFASGYQSLSALPIGIVNTDQSSQRGLPNFGYRNYGNIEYYGADISTEFAASDNISFFANYSWLSQNYFEKNDLGVGETGTQVFSLNTPKHRVKAGLTYYPSKGFTGGLSMRYQNSFSTTNFGWYNGFVPKRTVWDAHIGYKFSKKTHLNINITNLMGERYRVYNGMPEIGASAVAALRYDF
tara:strand:- start:1977 stop:4496 length:2520 start_codon:yes stop_codon:yes gene_type:complete